MPRPVVGTRLAGRYEVRALATGSSGHLFRGFDEQIGVEVALRIIDDHLLRDDAERRAFVRHATRAKTLQHPNLIRLYDVLVDDDAVFIVMQWAPGERLSQRLTDGRMPDASEARSILRRVGAGIAHAHQHGVITGNLRADTIVLYPDGLKVTNVGIGPALPRERFLSAISDRGALLDLAPELRTGAEIDARTDVFALSRLAERLLDPAQLSEGAREVLRRGLADDAALRPRDIEAFVRELESALDGRPLDRPPAVPTGYDTERVERLPPLPTESDIATRVDVRVAADHTQEPTVGSGRNSRVVELSVDDLVEVATSGSGEGMTRPIPKAEPSPDVTDVGRRTPVHAEASGEEHIVTAPVAARPRDEEIPMLPSRPEPSLDDDATRPHEKLPMVGAIELSRTEAEPIPTLEAALVRREPFAWMPLVLAVAVVMGGAIVVVGLRATDRPPPQPIVLEVRANGPTITVAPASPPPPVTTPIVTPMVTPPVVKPETSPLPIEQPLVTTLTPMGACPLGMAKLGGAHPYCIDLYEYPGGHTIPRTRVSWHDAGEVCQSRGLRLCSDVEWEQACRGPQQASFPYGASYDAARCNTGGKAAPGAILPAGEMARCRSASGAYDMSGNVAEWTSSGSQRGGSVLLGPPNGRCSHAVHMADPNGAADVGFRCCSDER